MSKSRVSVRLPYSNLVAYWSGNDTDVDEVSGVSLITSISGYGEGVVGNAFKKISNGTRYEIPYSEIFDIADNSGHRSMSISGYFKTIKLYSTQIITLNDSYNIYTKSGKLYSSMGTLTNKIEVSIDGVPDGDTFHFVMTYNGNQSTSGIKLYINGVEGVLTNSSLGVYVASTKSSINLRVGNGQYNVNENNLLSLWEGLAYWDKVLSAVEVLEIYNKQLTEELL